MSDRLLPLDAERAVLGSLLLDRDAIADVAEIVATPDAFTLPPHRTLYRAVLTLFARHEPADVVTLTAHLATQPDAPDASYLAGLMAEVPTSVHAGYYAHLVRNAARLRALQTGYQDALRQCMSDPALDPADVLAGLVGTLMDDGGTQTAGPRAYAELIPETQERIVLEQAGVIERDETPTGFWQLDDILNGGAKPGELIILAARSSMGKSAFAYELLRTASRRGIALLFSAEMSEQAITRRGISRETGIPLARLDTAKLSPGEYAAFMTASEHMKTQRIHIDELSGITTDQMIVRTQRVQRLGKVALVVFDYMELAGDQGKRNEPENLRLGGVVHKLKHIARACHVPVVALSQVSREVETRKTMVPKLSDLRWSGAIEQDADKVIFLYRHDYYVQQGIADPIPELEGICQVYVSKHRNGPTGSVKLRYHGETFRFESLEPSYAQAAAD